MKNENRFMKLMLSFAAFCFLTSSICFAQPGQGRPDRATITARMQERFAEMDKDGDGKVSIADQSETRQGFLKQMDANKDGIITKAEMTARFSAGGAPGRPTGRPTTGRDSSAPTTGLSSAKSVAKGEKAGIEVDQFAPDFDLEPVQLYPEFKQWLGDKAPKTFEDKIQLSDLVGEKEVMLLFGSYT